MTRKLTYEERRKNWRAVSLLGKRGAVKKVASTPAGRRRKKEKSDGSVLHDSGRKEGRKREKMMRHTLSVGEESIFSLVHFLVG